MSKRDRWPKPLESHVADLNQLVVTAHHEAKNLEVRKALLQQDKGCKFLAVEEAQPKSSAESATPANTADPVKKAEASLLATTHAISNIIELLEHARLEWWNSPMKRVQRRELQEKGEIAKLTDLQKINNKCIDMIGDMSAKLGLFVKWTLGVEGGLGNLGKVIS